MLLKAKQVFVKKIELSKRLTQEELLEQMNTELATERVSA
jgi:hypothetical protein